MIQRAIGASLMVVMSLSATSRASDFRSSEDARPAAGLVIATLGVIGFGGAVLLGRERMPSNTAHCSVDVCTSTAMLVVEDARSQSNTAFRLMAASALALVGGVALYATSETSTRWSRAEIAFGSGGLTFKTTF